ncbi:ABC transporter substrate-binding protein [Arthrobacter sp. NyZ413]|uniref:ABC transporter substrate-binding protein n=1 Tax=Arthrobacter sp. NyZ413 TaxID=3144669 RepID=UPI003BF7904B
MNNRNKTNKRATVPRPKMTLMAVFAAVALTMDELVKQAQTEGEVDWSAAKPQAQMQPAIDLFEQKYPGIKVKYTNTKAPDQVSQLKVEVAAKKVSIDVAFAGGLTVPPAQTLADTVDWTQYGVPAEDSMFSNKLVYIWSAPKVWAYNTTKVKPADVPHTWDDLLNPRWAGGQVAADSRADFMTVWDLDPSMGQDKADAWAKQFAAQKPHYTTDTTSAESLIESGQVSIGTSLINLVLEAQKKGAPVAMAPISPTNANESYLYVPKGAPHPAAAVLLTSFLSSDPAQAALAKSYNSRIPTSTDCSNPGQSTVLKTICAAGIKWDPTTADGYTSLADFFPKAQTALGTNIG